MARFGHGEAYSPRFAGGSALLNGAQAPVSSFDFMFPTLRNDPNNLLPVGADTIANLKLLGAAIEDVTAEDPAGDGPIPAGYTYFGQFLDHDITLQEPGPNVPEITAPDLAPLPDPAADFINAREPALDLDCLYGGLAQRDPNAPGRMLIGTVSPVGDRPDGKGDLNDLPRRPPHAQPELDREALIGDPRNDENLVVAQLHTAFLRAHNALVAQHGAFEPAARVLRQMFQRIVLQDFLPRICDPAVVADVLAYGPRHYTPASASQIFMPFEYSVAAYRFGHSMVREVYNHNRIFPDANFRLLFTFTALSGDMFDLPTLPENWIIQWERFLPLGPEAPQPARKIDTKLAEPLANLPDSTGQVLGDPMRRLGVRNLLRGYLLGLPTGQAVAQAMGLVPLSGATLTAAVPADQAGVLEATGFDTRTPLWFYILAEAADPQGPAGAHLGPVGSRIVVETLWNLVRFSPDSIIGPDLRIVPGDPVTLADLIQLSGNGA